MKKTRIIEASILSLCMLFSATFVSCDQKSDDPPKPYGVLPSESQLDWQKMEYYMFIHFGPNTFTDVEWGNGKEDPKVFNPTNVDCRQWAATAKAAGMKGIILTAKHHDGFCLWPSKYSTHTVRESLWKEGKGDLLKELSEACKEYGLKFGVYLSPWDQNHPAYGTPEYNQIFVNTLTEVLSNYGEIFEQWFDGANGEGHGGKKQEYDWNLFHETVYKYQPQAIIFSDIGPGCRWVGNEEGIAGATNWSRLNIDGFTPGAGAPPTDTLNIGNIYGKAWIPVETDVSIRPGWFFSPSTNDKVKSVDDLMNIYYSSVGRNSNLLLNVPPARSGRIHVNDSTRLMEFRRAIDEVFENDLTKGASITASQIRGKSDKFTPSNLLNDDYDTYWATNDDQTTASLELDLGTEKSFNRFSIQEYIPLGQRVEIFSIDAWVEGKWSTIAKATTIGYKRILRFPTVTTSKLKINIEKSLACPVLNKVALYLAPEKLSAPHISRDKVGKVSIKCSTPDPEIRYTTDGSQPTISSPIYDGEFDLAAGGVVKAIALVNNGKDISEVIEQDYDLAPVSWTVVSPNIQDIGNAIDATLNVANIPVGTVLVIDFGKVLNLKGFSFTPVNNTSANNVYKYNLYISENGTDWTKVKNNATFNNIKNNPIKQDVLFDKIVNAKFIKLEPIETTSKGINYSVTEIGVITR